MTEVGVRTDKGRVREANEDSYGLDSRLNLFVLSDGMGGLGFRRSRQSNRRGHGPRALSHGR